MYARVLIAIMLCLATVVGSADTLFVAASAGPGGNGQSWPTAFRTLNFALADWSAGDEIWVASGAYTMPDSGYKVRNGMRFYGGFRGTEVAREERDWYRNRTILQSDDGAYIFRLNDCDSSTRIDGFVMQGSLQSALYVDNGAPRIFNCHFRNCTSPSDGAAIFARGVARMRVEYCVFEDNEAAGRGGAVFLTGTQKDVKGWGPFFGQCHFVRNTAARGGAMAMVDCAGVPQIASSVYYGNVATVAGGAFFGNYAYPYINNTTLVRNTLNPPSETGGKTIALSGGHLQNSIIWNGDEDFTPHVIKLELNGDTAKLRALANNIERDFDYGFVQFDPSFTNINDPDGADNFYGTDDDGLYLGEGSFVRNYGLIDGFVNHRQQDAVGNPRLVGRKIDLGAYETQRMEGRLGFRDVMRDLRKGGLVLMYRHGKTDWESKDPGPSPECFPGRNLNAEGREQCTGIGAQQRMLGIPVGDLFTSPACRCWETLQKMHGSYTVKGHWGGGGASGATADARLADLETVPTVGNRFISTHDGVCQYVFNRDGGGEIITTAEYMEGDCLIIRPLGDTLEILAQWCSDTWERYHVRFPEGETSVEDDATVVQVGNVTAVPQPAAEQVRLTSTVGGVARVVDAMGRMHAMLTFDRVDRQVTVDVASYPQGTYYLVGEGIRGSFVVIR